MVKEKQTVYWPEQTLRASGVWSS